MKPVILLIALTFHLIQCHAQPGVPLIQKVCQKSDIKDLCVSSLNSNPDGPKSKDFIGLELVAIRVASKHAQDTWGVANTALKNNTLEPVVEQDLSDCVERYLDVVQQLDDCIAALLANAYGDVSTWVDAAVADAVVCEKTLKSRPGKPGEIASRSRTLLSMLNNVKLINKQLAKN